MDQAEQKWPRNLSNSEMAGVVEYMARDAGTTLEYNVLLEVAERLKELN